MTKNIWKLARVAFRGVLVTSLLSLLASAQAVRYDSQVIGSKGPVANQNVAICSANSNVTSQPCSPLATLFTFNISAISRSAGLVTVTTSLAHGLGIGAAVVISGVADSTYNGPATVASVLSTTQFTYLNPGSNGSSSGGTVGGQNPITTDALGNYNFYATPGSYDVQAYGPQVATPFVLRNITVGGGTGGGVPTDLIGKVLTSQGISTPPIYITKPLIDARDGFGCHQDGSTDDTACVNSIISAIGSNSITILFTGKVALASNVTFPTNVSLKFGLGAGLQPATSTITTVKGDIIATPKQQIFFNANSGVTGTIDLTGNLTITNVYPEWWGAVAGGNASTNTIALQNAIYGAFGCGPIIACRTNASGNYKYNRVLALNGSYSINGQLNFYHVISFKVECSNRNVAGIVQTATNTEILAGESDAYGGFYDCAWSTTASQDLNHPLISLDFSNTQGADILPQFIDFVHNNFNGSSVGKIGVQIARSGGNAQGSNIHFDNCVGLSFTEAAYMIGAGSGGTATALATNAIEIQWNGGDVQSNFAYGIEDFGGGQLRVNGTTFEDGFSAQTGYDLWCSNLPGGESCAMYDVRSESLFVAGGTVAVTNTFNADQAYVPRPGQVAAVGDVIQGSLIAGLGVYYKVTVGGTFSGLGFSGSPRAVSSGTTSSLVDSLGGLTVNQWSGWLASIWSGTGAGEYCFITGNSATTINCSGNFTTNYVGITAPVAPDNTSTYFIEPFWGSAFSSGGVTWAALNRVEFGTSCTINGGFFPGVQLGCGGGNAGTVFKGQVTRADFLSFGFPLDTPVSDSTYQVTVGAPFGNLGGGAGNVNPNFLRSWNFSRNGITGLFNQSVNEQGSVPTAWAMGLTGGGTSTVDAQIGPNPETGTKNGSIEVKNNSTGSSFSWKFKANGDFAFVTSKGQHLETSASASDMSGTFGVAASTTGSVVFTTNYTATPVCVLTPQTTGLTSWYLSAISTTGFTVTVAPSGTYTFGYHCIGNPN